MSRIYLTASAMDAFLKENDGFSLFIPKEEASAFLFFHWFLQNQTLYCLRQYKVPGKHDLFRFEASDPDGRSHIQRFLAAHYDEMKVPCEELFENSLTSYPFFLYAIDRDAHFVPLGRYQTLDEAILARLRFSREDGWPYPIQEIQDDNGCHGAMMVQFQISDLSGNISSDSIEKSASDENLVRKLIFDGNNEYTQMATRFTPEGPFIIIDRIMDGKIYKAIREKPGDPVEFREATDEECSQFLLLNCSSLSYDPKHTKEKEAND